MAKQKKIEHQKDPAHFAIKRNRDGDKHIKNCSSGYTKTTSTKYRQVHHVIPVSSMSDNTIYEELGENVGDYMFIRNCLALTDWDINAADNVISLPIKRAFVDRSPSNWNGYPCHQVDHNPHYTKAVSKDLADNVWKPHLKTAEECKFNAESLAAELLEMSDDWRSFLALRGTSNGGTAFCWEHRLKLHSGEMSAPHGRPWYYPFSMHPATPTARKPAPDWSQFSGKMKNYLKKLFETIK